MPSMDINVALHQRVAQAEKSNAVMRQALATIYALAYPPLEGMIEVSSRKPTIEELAAEREAMAQDLDSIGELAASALSDAEADGSDFCKTIVGSSTGPVDGLRAGK